MRILYLVRFFFKIFLSNKIKYKGFVVIHKKTKIILENNARIIFGKNVVLKENTILYAKNGVTIILGDNCSLGHSNEVSANKYIEFGDDVITGPYVYIADSNHGYKQKDKPIRLQSMDVGKTIIGNNVWIGRGSMVLKDSQVSDNSIVGANSVVVKKFEKDVLIAGVPAKKVMKIYE